MSFAALCTSYTPAIIKFCTCIHLLRGKM